MRKQFRAADLYQARTGIECAPKIRGIRSFTMFENVAASLHSSSKSWTCSVEFTDGTQIHEHVVNVTMVRTFVKHVNSYLTETQEAKDGIH